MAYRSAQVGHDRVPQQGYAYYSGGGSPCLNEHQLSMKLAAFKKDFKDRGQVIMLIDVQNVPDGYALIGVFDRCDSWGGRTPYSFYFIPNAGDPVLDPTKTGFNFMDFISKYFMWILLLLIVVVLVFRKRRK